jgi:hypothetical protein
MKMLSGMTLPVSDTRYAISNVAASRCRGRGTGGVTNRRMIAGRKPGTVSLTAQVAVRARTGSHSTPSRVAATYDAGGGLSGNGGSARGAAGARAAEGVRVAAVAHAKPLVSTARDNT